MKTGSKFMTCRTVYIMLMLCLCVDYGNSPVQNTIFKNKNPRKFKHSLQINLIYLGKMAKVSKIVDKESWR
ncbi:hypothetical protein FACS1894132_03350 [Clostridia bacterium]|nr:hypothetical protein FACS1894132_03350 [Clostridia bacterium]